MQTDNRRALILRRTLPALLCLTLLFSGRFDTARAQQTIFNVPTTDVLDKGKLYGELDVSFKPNDAPRPCRSCRWIEQ
jgi:hypothetical protein